MSRKKRSSPRRVGFLPDIHIPHEDPRAVTWALDTLQEEKIDQLVLLGDVMCLDSVSRFMKSLRTQASLPEEMKAGRRFMRRVESRFGDIPVLFMEGNHEYRLRSYILKNAPALSELEELSFRSLFEVPERWDVRPYGDYEMIQGVLVQHGRKWGHSAYRQRLMYGCSSIAGHSHRLKWMAHRLATGKVIWACELGCLCMIDQGYGALNDWAHACGVMEDGELTILTPKGARVR